MICGKCFNQSEFDVRKEKEEIVVKGEPIQVVSDVTYCKVCGEKVWNDVLDDQNLLRAYKKFKTLYPHLGENLPG